jgi:hypothetical protein
VPGLQTWNAGPLTKGLLDTVTLGADLSGACRYLRNAIYTGGSQLGVRPGTALALTLKDDAGTPAAITSVCAIVPFADGALAVGHSTATLKVYLYRLTATMDGWYNAAGVLQSTLFPEPVGALWTGAATAPDVLVTEGLGTAYIANTGAADDSGLYYPTKSYTIPATIATMTADLDNSGGAEDLYFSGVVAFKQHLWAWGFGAGTTVGTTTYRPELARFSAPNFGAFSAADSITLGDRVRSVRERIIGAGVAGDALFLGGARMLTRVTGFGRSSWIKEPLDRSYGFVGPKSMVTAGDTLYYWSHQGPLRITADSAPEPLWDALPATVATVINESRIVAGFDADRNQVLFAYDSGSGVGRAFCAYDVRRDVWLGPDADLGVAIRSMGTVEPIYASTATPPVGPSAPPTIPASTSSVGTTTATANWTNGDSSAETVVEYGLQSAGTYTVATTVSAGIATYTLTGLTAGLAYQWRVRHVRNGQYSAYYGPSASTQFTTTTSGGGALVAPSSCLLAQDAVAFGGHSNWDISWVNSGESGVSTEVSTSINGAAFVLQSTQGPGVSSYSVRLATASGTVQAEVRHVKSAETPSSYAFSGTETVL